MFDIWSVVQPSSLLAVFMFLALLGLLAGRRGVAGFFVVLALLLAVVPTVLNLSGMLAWELERRASASRPLPDEVDGILVLGGALDWRVSRERGQLTLNDSGERILAAAALAQRYPDARLALTGVYREDIRNDFVTEPRETSLIFGSQFGGRGIEFIGEARSTYEDALLALERLVPQAGETWLLVTSALHMPRAAAVFANLGWNPIPYPVDYRSGARPNWIRIDLRPGARLAELDTVVREWGAIFVYSRAGRIEWP